MEVETLLKINYKTTIGDSFDDDISEEEKNELIEKHIQEYCQEHDISPLSVTIIKPKHSEMCLFNKCDCSCKKCKKNQDCELFKCRSCGEKYKNGFCSTQDIGLCRWCSGEET